MPTPADQRLLELLDKWLKSLELHIGYSSLDRESYWRIQPWPEHQRPSRWIIDLAVQKAVALKSQVQERIKAGDTRFSDALELMTFLANLIGSEHIERFIPLAEKQAFAHADFAAGPNQAFPIVRLGGELAGQENLDAAAEGIACRRIVRADRVGAGAFAANSFSISST